MDRKLWSIVKISFFWFEIRGYRRERVKIGLFLFGKGNRKIFSFFGVFMFFGCRVRLVWLFD